MTSWPWKGRCWQRNQAALAASEAESMLYGAENAAVDAVAARRPPADAVQLDPKLQEPLEMIRTARANLEEARALSAYAQKIEADPNRLSRSRSHPGIDSTQAQVRRHLESAIETLERARNGIAELEGVEESGGSTARFGRHP